MFILLKLINSFVRQLLRELFNYDNNDGVTYKEIG